MVYVLFSAVLLGLAALAWFVHTVVRSAVRQIVSNRHAGTATVAYWTNADEPIDLWPTYTDPRAVDLDAVPVDEPMTGETARAMRDALRTPPRDFGRGYDELNTATGGRTWDELNG